MKSRSQPSSTPAARAASLSLLFTRFRVTAFPTLLLTEKPNRLRPRPFLLDSSTNRPSRLPLARRSDAKSSALVRRLSFCTGRADPSSRAGTQTASLDRPLNMRRFRTFRPPRVLMRALNPWVLARRLFLG